MFVGFPRLSPLGQIGVALAHLLHDFPCGVHIFLRQRLAADHRKVVKVLCQAFDLTAQPCRFLVALRHDLIELGHLFVALLTVPVERLTRLQVLATHVAGADGALLEAFAERPFQRLQRAVHPINLIEVDRGLPLFLVGCAFPLDQLLLLGAKFSEHVLQQFP